MSSLIGLPQTSTIAEELLPEVHLVGICLDCKKRHEYKTTSARWLHYMEEWRQKHLGHRIEFRSPKRKLPRKLPDGWEDVYAESNREPWWLEFGENSDVKTAYGASAAFTITLASLGTSATLVAGRNSTAVSNATNLYLDAMIGGKVNAGTSPTAAMSIRVYAYGSILDTPEYLDTITGADAAVTMTSTDIRDAYLRLLAIMATDNTSDRQYPFAPTSLATAFGGVMPSTYGVWVTHQTGQNLNSTAGNHRISYKPVYATAS